MKKCTFGLTLVMILFVTYTAAADTPLNNYLQSIIPDRAWSVPATQQQQAVDQAAPVSNPEEAVIQVKTEAPGNPAAELMPVNSTGQSPIAGGETSRGGTSDISAADSHPVAAAPVIAAKPAPPATKPPVAVKPAAPPSGAAQEMLGYINAAREKNGFAPLTLSNSLCQGAYLKSKDMGVNSYFSHNSPTYGDPFTMMKGQGITYRTAAENIAKNFTVLGSHNAFMNSSGHRANILNPSFHKVGLGFYQKDNYLYVTQWFTD